MYWRSLKNTGCRPKQNGSMPHEPEVAHPSLMVKYRCSPVIMIQSWVILAGIVVIQKFPDTISLPKRSQIHGDFMTCTAVFGSGAQIGMVHTHQRPLPILAAL